MYNLYFEFNYAIAPSQYSSSQDPEISSIIIIIIEESLFLLLSRDKI